MATDLDNSLKHRLDPQTQAEQLAAMRRRDFTITEAIKATMQQFGVGLGEAKAIVTSDPSWSEIAEANKPLQEAFLQSLHDVENSEK